MVAESVYRRGGAHCWLARPQGKCGSTGLIPNVPASAAIASGLVQTALSKVTRPLRCGLEACVARAESPSLIESYRLTRVVEAANLRQARVGNAKAMLFMTRELVDFGVSYFRSVLG